MFNLQGIYGTKSEETIIKWDDVSRKLVKQCCKEVTQGISWTSEISIVALELTTIALYGGSSWILRI